MVDSFPLVLVLVTVEIQELVILERSDVVVGLIVQVHDVVDSNIP